MSESPVTAPGVLVGRHALVTGAASGIGAAVATRLAEAGATVTVLDRDEEGAAKVAATIGAGHVVVDLADPAAIAALDVRADILVNNAGIQRVGLVGTVSFADFSAVVATHLHGFFLCASQAVPRMLAGGRGGSIVSIASTAAFVGLPGRGAYCAAKAGILGLTRALSLEVATAGIRVNAVAPGFTRTKFIDQGLADGSLREDWMLARVPMHRLAHVDEIAGAVRYLVGDDAAYMTGQTMVVDGGWIVQGIPDAPDWLQSPAVKGT